MEPGIVILDASVLRHLVTESGVASTRSRLRTANLRIWPSKLNVLEVLKDGNDARANRLLEVLAAWQGEFPILPLPNEILRAAGQAALSGGSSFVLSGDLAEFITRSDDDLEQDRRRSIDYLQPMLDAFEQAHQRSARDIRRGVKPNRDELQDLHTFLEDVWGTDENTQHQIGQIWAALGLPDAPPPDLPAKAEVWRILHDALGASIFYRAVRTEAQARPAGFADLMQLLYLAGADRSRIFVSDDKALVETAKGILIGRYDNVRVMTGEEFFSPQP